MASHVEARLIGTAAVREGVRRDTASAGGLRNAKSITSRFSFGIV
jgi:hypothetical protein